MPTRTSPSIDIAQARTLADLKRLASALSSAVADAPEGDNVADWIRWMNPRGRRDPFRRRLFKHLFPQLHLTRGRG